jgi:hypothetical protein
MGSSGKLGVRAYIRVLLECRQRPWLASTASHVWQANPVGFQCGGDERRRRFELTRRRPSPWPTAMLGKLELSAQRSFGNPGRTRLSRGDVAVASSSCQRDGIRQIAVVITSRPNGWTLDSFRILIASPDRNAFVW